VQLLQGHCAAAAAAAAGQRTPECQLDTWSCQAAAAPALHPQLQEGHHQHLEEQSTAASSSHEQQQLVDSTAREI
jgi:hypothetical protein